MERSEPITIGSNTRHHFVRVRPFTAGLRSSLLTGRRFLLVDSHSLFISIDCLLPAAARTYFLLVRSVTRGHWRESNPLPSRCKRDALPFVLQAHLMSARAGTRNRTEISALEARCSPTEPFLLIIEERRAGTDSYRFAPASFLYERKVLLLNYHRLLLKERCNPGVNALEPFVRGLVGPFRALLSLQDSVYRYFFGHLFKRTAEHCCSSCCERGDEACVPKNWNGQPHLCATRGPLTGPYLERMFFSCALFLLKE